ncbi:Rqc2 family fibronectin-binding protein [Hominenteromicrobium sp.]|uniref:Rqc2 family fibronectin-binding protein n=1 Tax=Hominenteromicrobium sp. TaxID=3073581 RepID=UPI003A93ECFB
MALDGVFLRHLKEEIGTSLLGTRVDRVFQPNRDELILAFRGFSAAYKLLISARANSARVNLTTIPVENPQQPPMLCMLLRKKLQGAKLLEITQPDLERALMLKFDSVNELGDHVELTLAVEIMGRYSNIILVDENGKIIDALKRVDAEMSSERLVLPGLLYRLPPPQDKLSMLTCTVEEIMARIDALPRDMELSKALMSVLQGISPIIAREVENSAGLGHEMYVKSMTPPQRRRTEMYVTTLMETAKNVSGTPHIVIDPQNKPKDFAFMDIRQYGSAMTVSEKKSFSEMLDAFYAERDQIERMRVKSQDLLRLLANHADRLSRKIANQQAELSACAERDTLRIKGDLLSANMYAIQKGETSVKLQNFYDENLAELEIALDPALTPQQNAQKYYKNYRKAKTAEEKLTEQIGLAQTELTYIDSVFESLALAENERDLNEIRAELAEQGYVRRREGKKNQKQPALSAPLKFKTSDGFTVLVGRNNRQNDKLTMKDANNNDIWFHTKNIPGSHTVLVTDGKAPTETAMEEAAVLAAQHSRAKDSAQVPVDYTQIRYVSKPQGAKPGMVIYVQYKTVYVDPTTESKAKQQS